MRRLNIDVMSVDDFQRVHWTPYVWSEELLRICQEARRSWNFVDWSHFEEERQRRGEVYTHRTSQEPLKEFAYTWKRLTHCTLRAKLSERGHRFCLKTVQNHLKVLKARHKTVKLKPLLTDNHKENRLRFIMDQVDCRTAHGRQELKFRDHLDTIMVDESWMYLMRNDTVAELEQDGTGDGWKVKVVTQSSQSPDLNILDLGFFH